MDPHTHSLYLVAGGLSISLSAVLLAFAYLQPDTRLMKSCAIAILMLSAGFTVSGYGPLLPRWATVMGTNMLLIAAGAVFHSGFAAYGEQRPPRLDRFGWGVVALTGLPFWYWGLMEPDGHYRSAVFSFAVAAINVRTALVLGREALQRSKVLPLWVLAILFGILTVWMAARGVLSLSAEPPSVSQRGANPTSWITVFWYIVLVSVMTVIVIWLEFSRETTHPTDLSDRADATFSLVEYFRKKLRLLWATVLILMLGILSEAGVYYTKSYALEAERLAQVAELTNDALVQHSIQVISQVDTILHSVRSFYLQTGSAAETENFINTLPFDKSTIDNIYLISPQATVLISHDPAALGRSLADRDYFAFHRATSADQIFISAVESGRVTGKHHFRVTRRISNADGSFAGIVLATVNPESFSHYYRNLTTGSQNIAALLGTLDKKLRARVPLPPADRWQIPVESPLWSALEQATSGRYANTSDIGQIRRVFAYKKVGELPLVMVSGFAESDLRANVHERLLWLTLGTLTVLLTILILATLLTVEIRRRNEQHNFMSMLSHELKTPLSVLRMAMEHTDTLSARTREHAQKSVQDMDAIMERCLQVDRLQHHRQAATRQSCDLVELLADLQTTSQEHERLLVHAAELPRVMADAQLLHTALSNLIDNALKYSAPNTLVQITLSRHIHKNQSGILMVLANSPGSAGMPDPRKVFKKYYRSHGAHRKTGSGLGLFLVHNVVRSMGGWVRHVPSDAMVQFELWIPV